eukprot:gene6792-4873_t
MARSDCWGARVEVCTHGWQTKIVLLPSLPLSLISGWKLSCEWSIYYYLFIYFCTSLTLTLRTSPHAQYLCVSPTTRENNNKGKGRGMWRPEQLVRRHIRQGLFPRRVQSDLSALKAVLQDWVHAVEQTPLLDKAAAPAELSVQLHYQTASEGGGGDSTYVHVKRVPLAVWPAVLPWEIQRGLSKTPLPRRVALSHHDTSPAGTTAEQALGGAPQKEKESKDRTAPSHHFMECGGRAATDVSDDPLGVVFSQVQASQQQQQQAVARSGGGRSNSVFATSSPPAPASVATPGMLFMLDVPSVKRQQGEVHFWSGAIVQSIDVLVLRPGLLEGTTAGPNAIAAAGREQEGHQPSPLTSSSASFISNVRAWDLRDRLDAREGPLSPALVRTFFPPHDLHFAPSEQGGVKALHLHHYGHLDPFPRVLKEMERTEQEATRKEKEENTENKQVEEEGQGGALSFSVRTVSNSPPYAHYVLECPRHTMQHAIQAAVEELQYIVHHKEPQQHMLDPTAVAVKVSMRLSAELEEQLVSRAQIFVGYVSSLRQAMEQHMRRLSRPPVVEDLEDVSGPTPGGEGDGEEEEDLEEGEEAEMEATAALVSPSAAPGGTEMVKRPATPSSCSTAETVAPRRAPATSYASDRLAAVEGDGQPDTIVPSIPPLSPAQQQQMQRLGRHRGGPVQSARERSRYPMTSVPFDAVQQSSGTVSQPVDYELIGYAFRLGIGMDSVLRHYYERMLMEWKDEVRRIRRRQREVQQQANNTDEQQQQSCRKLPALRQRQQADDREGAAAVPSPPSLVQDEAVYQLLALVKDSSLQFPEELGALVELCLSLCSALQYSATHASTFNLCNRCMQGGGRGRLLLSCGASHIIKFKRKCFTNKRVITRWSQGRVFFKLSTSFFILVLFGCLAVIFIYWIQSLNILLDLLQRNIKYIQHFRIHIFSHLHIHCTHTHPHVSSLSSYPNPNPNPPSLPPDFCTLTWAQKSAERAYVQVAHRIFSLPRLHLHHCSRSAVTSSTFFLSPRLLQTCAVQAITIIDREEEKDIYIKRERERERERERSSRVMPAPIDTSATAFGDYWSNRDVTGKGFKNYGPPRGMFNLPFHQRLRLLCTFACSSIPKPKEGYKVFQRTWHVRCEPHVQISALRSLLPESSTFTSAMPSTIMEEIEGTALSALKDVSSAPAYHDPEDAPLSVNPYMNRATSSISYRNEDGQPLKDLIFWLGHASQLLCLVQPDINILLDPIFSERASPLRHWGPKRRFPPPLAVEELPRIDFVLVSHNHYDHLDSQSIRAVYKRFPNVHFVLPKNMSTLLKPWGIPADAITELDWWEEAELLLWRGSASKGVELRIACTPAQHYGLHGLGDRNKVLWCGWVLGWKHLAAKPVSNTKVLTDRHSVPVLTGPLRPSATWNWEAVKTYYFPGDTAMNNRMFQQIHLHYPRIDMAGLPIGAYSPRAMLRDQHIDPEAAVDVFQILEIRQAYGLHWGTFELGLEPVDEPPEVLKDVLAQYNLRCSGGGEVQDGEERAFRLIQTGGYLLF